MSTSCLINSARLKVWRRTGSEGPHYDPYSFTEYEIERKGRAALIVHMGLGVWTKLGKCKPVDYRDSKPAHDYVKRKCGYTLTQLERFARNRERARDRALWQKCPTHHKNIVDGPGYPGEYIVACKDCGEVLSCDFNESAVI